MDVVDEPASWEKKWPFESINLREEKNLTTTHFDSFVNWKFCSRESGTQRKEYKKMIGKIGFYRTFIFEWVLKAKAVKVSHPKYSGPKLAHQFNLDQIEN